jgi:uncharacterized protein with HEPN domain
MTRAHEDYLKDMLDNAERAIKLVQGMDYDDFVDEEKTVYAVVRAIEVIGEAARKVPEPVRKANPEIP